MNWVHPLCLLMATVVVAFLQSSLNGLRHLVAAQPDLMPALVVYAALHTSLTTTTATAVLGGLAQDTLSAGPFGLSVLPLAVLGIYLHRRRELLLRDSAWAQALLGGAGALWTAVSTWGLLLLLWPLLSNRSASPAFLPEQQQGLAALPSPGAGLLWQWVVLACVGIVGTPVVFRVFRWIEATFHYRPVARPVHPSDREIQRGRF